MDEEAKEILGNIDHHLGTISYVLTALILEKVGGMRESDWFNDLMNMLADKTDGIWQRKVSEKEKSIVSKENFMELLKNLRICSKAVSKDKKHSLEDSVVEGLTYKQLGQTLSFTCIMLGGLKEHIAFSDRKLK